MAQWQHKLGFGDFYHKYPEELSIQEVATRVIEKLEELIIEIRKEPDVMDFKNWEKVKHRTAMLELADDLEGIIVEFQEVEENEDADEDDFNYAMEDLYDWGDTKFDDQFNGARMCFVDTF